MAERMDHEKMRRAAELPVRGPAATDTLAASGGLDLPGRGAERVTPDQQADLDAARRDVPATAASIDRIEGRDPDDRWRTGMRSGSEPTQAPARSRGEDPGDVSAARLEPIPGEVDNTTAMSTQPGIVGTTGYGVEAAANDDSTMDEELLNQTRWEAGGRIPPRK